MWLTYRINQEAIIYQKNSAFIVVRIFWSRFSSHFVPCFHICRFKNCSEKGGVVVVIVWQLDLQLPVQSVPITKIVSLNPVHGEVYSIQHYVIKFVRELRQVGGFLEVLRFHPLSKPDCHDISEILLKVVLNTINQTKLINNCSKCPISFLLNYIVEGYSLNVMLTHLDKYIRFHYKSRDHVHSFVT